MSCRRISLIDCFAMKIVRHEKEGDKNRRPKVNRRPALPHSYFSKMRKREPGENPHDSEESRLPPESPIASGMNHKQHNKGKKHQRIGKIEEPLPAPQEQIEAEYCHHTSTVKEVVTPKRFHYIGKGYDMLMRQPNHRVVIIITMQGHQMIESIHQQEDTSCHEHSTPKFITSHPSDSLPPKNSRSVSPETLTVYTRFFCHRLLQRDKSGVACSP